MLPITPESLQFASSLRLVCSAFIYLLIYFIRYVFKTLSNDETMWKEAALKCYSDTSVKKIGKATGNLMYKPFLGRDFNPGSPVFEA